MYRVFCLLTRLLCPPTKLDHLGLKHLAKIGGPCARCHSTPVSVFLVVLPPMNPTKFQLILIQLQNETDAPIMKLKNY